MDDARPFQEYFDALTRFASTEERKPDLLSARADYLKLTGEVFEDDKQFESRMSGFLDYYLLDRIAPATGKTPAQELSELKRIEGATDEAAVYRGFTETLHSLFEIRKLKKGQVRVRELFTGKDHDVSEERPMVGMEKGDLVEARLVPFGGVQLLSNAFFCHPREAFKAIRAEVKRRKKAEPERPTKELVWDCARRSIKVDRYRQLPVERIFDFEHPLL